MSYLQLLGGIIILAVLASTAICFCELSLWQKLCFIVILGFISSYIFDVLDGIRMDHLDNERMVRQYAKEIEVLKKKREELEVCTIALALNPETGERRYILTKMIGTPQQIIDFSLKCK